MIKEVAHFTPLLPQTHKKNLFFAAKFPISDTTPAADIMILNICKIRAITTIELVNKPKFAA